MDFPHSRFYIGEESTPSTGGFNALLRVWTHNKVYKIFFFDKFGMLIQDALMLHLSSKLIEGLKSSRGKV